MRAARFIVALSLLAAGGVSAQEAPAAAAPQAGEDEAMPRVDTSAPGGAMDEIVLERTEITGNRELPKVLYIVPWQKSDPGALVGRPVNTLLDEVLAPVDREEFVRQVDYYSDLYGDPGAAAPAASRDAGASAASRGPGD